MLYSTARISLFLFLAGFSPARCFSRTWKIREMSPFFFFFSFALLGVELFGSRQQDPSLLCCCEAIVERFLLHGFVAKRDHFLFPLTCLEVERHDRKGRTSSTRASITIDSPFFQLTAILGLPSAHDPMDSDSLFGSARASSSVQGYSLIVSSRCSIPPPLFLLALYRKLFLPLFFFFFLIENSAALRRSRSRAMPFRFGPRNLLGNANLPFFLRNDGSFPALFSDIPRSNCPSPPFLQPACFIAST